MCDGMDGDLYTCTQLSSRRSIREILGNGTGYTRHICGAGPGRVHLPIKHDDVGPPDQLSVLERPAALQTHAMRETSLKRGAMLVCCTDSTTS
jgi:hypothetical protein